jgi:uncharacterized repeat protein (TIGR02543 family)
MTKNIKKQFSGKTAICFLGLIIFLLLSGCSGPDEDAVGFVTINVGGASSVGASLRSRSTSGYPPGGNTSAPSLAQITYKVFFNETEKSGTVNGASIQFSVAVGTYTVRIEAYEPSGPGGSPSLYATGEDPNVVVQSGLNTGITIQMHEALTVYLKLNDGTPNNHMTVQAGINSTIDLPSSTPTRQDYIFDCWYPNANGTGGTGYAPGDPYSLTTADVFLYAKWTPTITYDINGGTGTTPAKQNVAGTGVTIADGTGFYKAGYKFNGWHINAAGTTGSTGYYPAGSTYTQSTSITLYAIWETPVFTVISDFGDWLSTEHTNGISTAYTVKLNLNSLGGTITNSSSLGYVLYNYPNIFVKLDLSGSTLSTSETLGQAFAIGDGGTTAPHCKNLVSIKLPTSAKQIGYNAFHSCENLESVEMPNVEVISAGAFTNCEKLTSVKIPIPNGATIGNNAFAGCTGLTEVIFSGNGIIFEATTGNVFQNVGDLTTVYSGAGTYTRSPGSLSWSGPY